MVVLDSRESTCSCQVKTRDVRSSSVKFNPSLSVTSLSTLRVILVLCLKSSRTVSSLVHVLGLRPSDLNRSSGQVTQERDET